MLNFCAHLPACASAVYSSQITEQAEVAGGQKGDFTECLCKLQLHLWCFCLPSVDILSATDNSWGILVLYMSGAQFCLTVF